MSYELRQILDSEVYQLFTPKEMYNIAFKSGLQPILLDSKSPTGVDDYILQHNFPKFVQKIPKTLINPIFMISLLLFRLTRTGHGLDYLEPDLDIYVRKELQAHKSKCCPNDNVCIKLMVFNFSIFCVSYLIHPSNKR